jgi:hypothetical protein
MEPLTNLQVFFTYRTLNYRQLQIAIKDNVDIFYFAVVVPLNVYFDENGQMDKRDFLQLWKEIPEQNEVQFTLQNANNLSAGVYFI